MLSNTCHMFCNNFHMLFKDYNTMICCVRNLICCVKLDSIWIAMYFSDGRAWESIGKLLWSKGWSPFATCGNDQCRSKVLCVLTSAALPSTSVSSPLHAPFTPSTSGSQVPGVDSPCSPLHQARGGVSPSRGNVSKTRASLPQATVEQNRRELVAFCQQCWQFTNFRHNTGEIGILPLKVISLIDTYGTAEHQPGRLRGELTSQEIKKYVTMCLKPGKSTGPDRCPNELTKTITDEEFQTVKMWVNGNLT